MGFGGAPALKHLSPAFFLSLSAALLLLPHMLAAAAAYLAHTPPPPRFTWRATTTAFRLRSRLVSNVEV